jgi:hypothetical protein
VCRRSVPLPIPGALVENHEDVIGLEGVLQHQLVKQGHDVRGDLDEALFVFDHALGQRSIR